MGRNSAYSSRNLLGSLLVLQHKFLALGFFFQTFHLSIILARLAIGQSPIMSFLIMYYHVLSLPHSQYQVSHLQPPVSPFRLFWCFGLFSLPILTELIFSWMSYKDRTPGVWAKQDGPLKGETKWGVVRFAPKDCKNLAEKVVLLLCLLVNVFHTSGRTSLFFAAGIWSKHIDLMTPHLQRDTDQGQCHLPQLQLKQAIFSRELHVMFAQLRLIVRNYCGFSDWSEAMQWEMQCNMLKGPACGWKGINQQWWLWGGMGG